MVSQDMETQPLTRHSSNNKATEAILEMEATHTNETTQQNFWQIILGCVLNNQVEHMNDYIRNNPDIVDTLRTYRYSNRNNKTLVTIACVDESVAATTLDALCSLLKIKDGFIEYVDELWYGWSPLHYVAKSGDPEKLRIIFNHIPETEINSLTYFSENPLQVLLQYHKSITSFDAFLYNGVEMKKISVIGPERENITTCAKILIEKRIDVNHINFWNETAICLSLRYKLINTMKLLLSVDYIDLDSVIESGKTIREYIQWNLYTSLPRSYIQEDPSTILFNLLKSGDEEQFIMYRSENFREYVNNFDGSDEYNSCGTMLQLCMRKGYYEFLQDKRSKIERLPYYDIKDSPMLAVFKTKGLLKSIIYLLDNHADPMITSRKFTVNLLQYSAVRGYYPFIALLLEHRNCKIQANHIFDVLSELFQTNLIFANQGFYKSCVLYLLLNKLVTLFEQKQEKMTTERLSILNKLLHQLNLECDDRGSEDSENICQILRLGANLSGKESPSKIEAALSRLSDDDDSHQYYANAETRNNRKMVIERLDPSILKSHFDNCIHGTSFKYDSIVQDDIIYNENQTLHFLIHDKYKQFLLGHPLMIELIKRKWSKVQWVFYADLLFYALLLIQIYIFTISANFNFFYVCFCIMYYFLLAFHIVKELLQLTLIYRLKYFLDTSNLLEVSTIICCLVNIFLPNIYSYVLAMLFSTFIFFVMLGQLPYFTKYTVIFSSIKYFFQYMGFYFIQFLCFALCFYLLFPFDNASTTPDWGDIFKNLFYTLIHFTGEFSDRVLEPTQYPVFGRIFMTVFIFCMTIILNNLLVGLIVADMDEIQKRSIIEKQIKLATFIGNVNTFVKSLHKLEHFYCIEKIVDNINIFRRGQKKIFQNVNINCFDDEKKEYLREIKNNRSFDRHVLRDLYNFLKN